MLLNYYITLRNLTFINLKLIRNIISKNYI